MNKKKPFSIATVLFFIFIFNLLFRGFSMDTIYALPVLFIGVVIFILTAMSKNTTKKPPSQFKDFEEHRYEDYYYHESEKHECEYCGHFNHVDREYCENCGAYQLKD